MYIIYIYIYYIIYIIVFDQNGVPKPGPQNRQLCGDAWAYPHSSEHAVDFLIHEQCPKMKPKTGPKIGPKSGSQNPIRGAKFVQRRKQGRADMIFIQWSFT